LGAERARHGLPLFAAALLLAVLLGVPPGNPATAGPPDRPSLTFSQNVLVDDGAGNAWTPTIAIDGGAKLHLAWSDDRGGFRRIFYTNSTDAGATWSPDWDVCGCPGTANAYDPAIGVDRSGGAYNGSVYIVWRETAGADADVYLRRSPDRGASWLPRVRVDAAPAGITSTAPALAVSATGDLLVAYADTRNNSRLQVFVRRSFDGGTMWSPETQVSQTNANSALPALTAGPRDVYLGWRELETTTLVASLWVARTADLGASWTARIVDTGPSPTDRRWPQIFVAPDGIVHMIWIAYDISGIPTVKASRSLDDGVSWSSPVRVDDAATGPLTYRAPRLASAAGDVYAVWADNRNADSDIFYTTSGVGGATWGDGTPGTDPRVDDTDSNAVPGDDATEQTDPAVVSDGFGVYVAWSDRRAGGNLDLYCSRLLIERVLATEFQDAPAGAEAVEIAAYGGSPISLAGYRLEIDAFALDLTGLGTLSPGQHKVVGDPAWADLVYDIPVPDEGGVIRVVDDTGAVVDLVAYGQRGPVPDPIPGETVERRWTGAKYSDDWARSSTPTWRGLNGVPATNTAPPVVLNEVLFNPTTPSDAFIELYYPGAASLDLFGYVIAGDAPFTIPSGTVSATDPYYVLRASAVPALFAAMDAAGDNVYLYDASGALLDMAGWSTSHAIGGSMARVPEGLGGHAGYEDASSSAAGWRFDRIPTVPLVVLRQDQQQDGNLGDTLQFPLTVVQKQTVPDVIDLTYMPGPDGWAVSLVDIASGAALQDHDGDGTPDTDRLPPGVAFTFAARLQIPATPPVANSEAVVVAAQASLTPLARGTVTLVGGTYPRIEPSASVDTDPIWVAGTPPPFPTDTNLTLTIAGRGSARVRRAPQDVVLLLDRSGSLADAFCPGCFPLLKDAAKTYVDNLSIPDQAAVIYFTNLVIPKGPLTTDYARVKADIDSESVPQGGTQIGEAIRAANNELGARGISFHFWAIILLTDGQDNAGGLDPLAEARTSATMGIRVFTIGLGPTVDETMLRNIAALTGGEYLHAATPQDLYGVYEKIGTLVDSLAGYDSDITDDIPMVEVTLPPYILIAPTPPNRFVDPATGGPRAPDYRVTTPAGTVLQWNVSTLRLNETWSVRFAIRSTRLGLVDVLAYPASRATYLRFDGALTTVPFPRTPVTVLQSSTPTVRYTITRSPEAGFVTVDGLPYAPRAVFDWYPGDTHTILVPATELFGPDSRYLLDAWDDGGAASHSVLVGTVNQTITAVFWVQHRPTVRLLGTSAIHDVVMRWTAAGAAASARASGTWADWVDEGRAVSADTLAAGSGVDERWVTEEDFGVPPWSAVGAPFQRSVMYFHQYGFHLHAAGLPPSRPAPLTSTAFGRTGTTPVSTAFDGWIDDSTDAATVELISVSATERYSTENVTGWRGNAPLWVQVRYYHQWLWRITVVGLANPADVDVSGKAYGRALKAPGAAPWTDWVDDASDLKVGDSVSVGPRERYGARDPTSWTASAAGDVTVRFVHEMRPVATLAGTDAGHTVSVTVRTASGERRFEGLYREWTQWLEVGGSLAFDRTTTGTRPRTTSDPVAFDVTTPFDATINYAAPLEMNLKPFVSAVFVAILLAVGLTVAYRRPLAFKGSRRGRERGPDDVRMRVVRDRRKTAFLIAAPFAIVEGAIGVASHFTGILRVPEEGSWVTLGLVVNVAILGSGVVTQIVARWRGYLAKDDLARAMKAASAARAPPPPPDEDD